VSTRRTRPRSRAWRRVSIPVTVLLALTAPRSLAAQVTGYEEGILEVTAERLPPLTILALIDSAGSVLLPLTQTLDYLGIGYTRTDSTFAITRLDGGNTHVSAVTRTIEHARGTMNLTPAQLVLVDRELYLHSDLHRVVLEGEVTVDMSRLQVMFTRSVPYPAQQRIVAEQRRAMLLLREQQLAVQMERDTVSYRSYTGIGIADWQVATNGLDPTRLTTLRTQAGAAVLGGDLNAGVTVEAGHDATETMRDFTLRYHRVFPTGPYVTQVRAGDILSSGLFARFMRGVEVSNRPFVRQYDLGTILVRPDLPTGWEYEVLQGNQLLGYSEGTRDPVAVTLRSGSTPLQVRMYGPAGQEVVSTLLYQTPVSLLPARAFEYAVGGGVCDGNACDGYAHGDARWGYSSLFTVGAGFELVDDTLDSHVRPYLLSSFSTGTFATGEVTVMPGGVYSGLFAFYPRDGTLAHLRATISEPGFGPISLLPGDRSRWDVEAMWDERLSGTLPLQTLRATVSVGGIAGRTDSWRVSAASSIQRGYLEVRYDHDDLQQEPHLFSGRATVLTPFRVAGRTLLPVVNTGLGVNQVGLRIAELGATLQLRANMNISANVQWSRGLSRPTLNVAWAARLGTVQTQIRAVSSERSGGTSAAIAGGSIALARDGSITHFPITRIGYAGLYGTVFIDRDGNGIFNNGDEAVPHAAVVAGTVQAVADDEGRYHIWGLQPYEVAEVSIDSTRIADPGLTTLHPALLVRPAPNVARRVDLPLVQTRELIGTITAHEDVSTVGALTLEITNLDSGTTMTTVTFSDGQYYVSRLRPGRYRLRVAQTTLDLLRAAPDPANLDFTVTAAGQDVIELPAIHLRPRSAPR
jgi:hypothetical protein